MSNAQRFIVAFNEIENYFRQVLQIGSEEKDFTALLIEYEGRHRLLNAESFDLRRFNDLRNAIVHGLYSSRTGRPIAEPRPDIVVAIERLRDNLVRPPLVSTIFQQQKVVKFNSDDPVSSPLRAVRDFDYSQFPIYKEGNYFKLLTTNCIARCSP